MYKNTKMFRNFILFIVFLLNEILFRPVTFLLLLAAAVKFLHFQRRGLNKIFVCQGYSSPK